MIPPINFCGGPPIKYNSQPDDDASPMSSPRGRSPTFKPCINAMSGSSSAVPSQNASTHDDSNGIVTTATTSSPSPSSSASSSPFPPSTEDGEGRPSTRRNSNATDLESFPDFDSSEAPLPPTPPPTPPPNPLPTPPPTPPNGPRQPLSSDARPPRVIKLEPWPRSLPSDSAGPRQGSSTDSRLFSVGSLEEADDPGANLQEAQVGSYGTDRILDRIDRIVDRRNEEQNNENHEADEDNDDDNCLLCRMDRIYNDPLSPSFVPPQPWPPFISSLLLLPCGCDPTHPFIARAGRSCPRLAPASARNATTTHTPTPQPTTTQRPATSSAFKPPSSWYRLPSSSSRRMRLRPHPNGDPRTLRLPLTALAKAITPRSTTVPAPAPPSRLLRRLRLALGHNFRRNIVSRSRHAAPPQPFATAADGFDFAEPISVPPAPPAWTLEGRAAGMHGLFATERQWNQTEAEAWAAEQDRAVWNHVVERNRKREGPNNREREYRQGHDRSADQSQSQSPDYQSAGECGRDSESEDEIRGESRVVYEVLSGEFMAKAYCEGEYDRELEEVMTAKVNRRSDTEDESELHTDNEDGAEREADDEDGGDYEYQIDGVGGFRIGRRRRSRNEAEVETDDEEGDGDGIRRVNVREYIRFFNSYVAGTAHRGGLGRGSVLTRM